MLLNIKSNKILKDFYTYSSLAMSNEQGVGKGEFHEASETQEAYDDWHWWENLYDEKADC